MGLWWWSATPKPEPERYTKPEDFYTTLAPDTLLAPYCFITLLFVAFAGVAMYPHFVKKYPCFRPIYLIIVWASVLFAVVGFYLYFFVGTADTDAAI